MRFANTLRSLLAAALTISGLACSADRPARGIVLITLDTTRADRIGCYGYAPAASSNLDRLASASTRFTEALSPVPITLPAHASMFTGSYPPVHGVRYNVDYRLPEGSVTVAEVLRSAGWATAAVPSAYPVSAATGLGQGFETYLDLFLEPGAGSLATTAQRKADDVARLGEDWLAGVARNGDRRFFLWLHFFDPHDPYEPPSPYRERFAGRPYDGEIAYTDNALGRVFRSLQQLGVWNDVLVIVAGDHGEGLGDHDEATHKTLVYQSTLRVPLLIKPPGAPRAHVVAEPVSLVDIAATLLDYAGAPPLEATDGISLRPAVAGKALPQRALYFESLAGSLNFGWHPLHGLRRGAWKYIESVSPELYNVGTDPREALNLAGQDREQAEDLQGDLRALRERWDRQSPGPPAAFAPMDPEARQRLASLGYLGGGGNATPGRGRNPREVVHLETTIELGKRRAQAGDSRGALEAWKVVLEEDPQNRYVLEGAAQAALALNDLDPALRFAESAVTGYPDSLNAWMLLGDVLLERGDTAKAVEAMRAALDRHAGQLALKYRLALARFLAGDPQGAARDAENVLRADPSQDFPNFLVLLATCKAKMGDESAARELLEKAIAKGYRFRKLLETAPELAPLRAVPGFRGIVAALPAD